MNLKSATFDGKRTFEPSSSDPALSNPGQPILRTEFVFKLVFLRESGHLFVYLYLFIYLSTKPDLNL